MRGSRRTAKEITRGRVKRGESVTGERWRAASSAVECF